MYFFSTSPCVRNMQWALGKGLFYGKRKQFLCHNTHVSHKLQLMLVKIFLHFIKKTHFITPLYGWGSTVSRLQSQYKWQFTFYHLVPRSSWYSTDRPQKDEKLSWPWNHPVVLNSGPLDWESSTLTTRPLQLLLQ